MKACMLLFVLFTSSVSLADQITIEYTGDQHPLLASWVLSCKKVGRKELQDQAQAYGIEIDIKTLRLSDAHVNTLAGYLWWSADVTAVNDRTDLFPAGKKPVLKKMTQKPLGGDCF